MQPSWLTLAFWQQQLLPVDILTLETKPIETRLVENMPVQQIAAEYYEEVKEVKEGFEMMMS